MSPVILTDETRKMIHAFLEKMRPEVAQKVSKDQQFDDNNALALGGRGWNILREGGTYKLIAIAWYRHIHKQGSKEWRPSIIIRALVEQAKAKS